MTPNPSEKKITESQIHLSFITPDKKVFEGDVPMVVIPGEEGDFGVLPRHAPFVSTLRAGVVKIYEGQKVSHSIPITGGVAEVNNDKCQILADDIAS